METTQDELLYSALSHALTMPPENMETTPQKTPKKRKARQGSKYDSPKAASSPLSSANPSFNVHSPTPTKGREKLSPKVAFTSPQPQTMQQDLGFGVTRHLDRLPEAGDTNTFLRQQILDTAFILYQQPLHTPQIKLVSLSGISIQQLTTNPSHPDSNHSNPIDLTGETAPIPVFRSSSGKFYPQDHNSSVNNNTATATEVTYYQLALYVDSDPRIESCICIPAPGENYMVVLGRCLRDLHAKVSRQLWIRRGVIKAVRNGFDNCPRGNGGVGVFNHEFGQVGGVPVGGFPIGGDIESYAGIIQG